MAIDLRKTYPIRLLVVRDKAEMGKFAAHDIRNKLDQGTNAHGGFATGSTPKPAYRALLDMHARGALNIEGLTTWNLDENIIDRTVLERFPQFASELYVNFMAGNLFDGLGISGDRRNIPDWKAKDPYAECIRFESKIRQNRLKFQILGMGPTDEKDLGAHIGFCESGTPFDSVTHVVELTQRTRVANSRMYMTDQDIVLLGLAKDEDPFQRIKSGTWTEVQLNHFYTEVLPRSPKHAMTMGIGTILGVSDSLLLLATGKSKAVGLRRTLLEPPTTDIPASAINYHPNTLVIADLDAVSELHPSMRVPGYQTLRFGRSA